MKQINWKCIWLAAQEMRQSMQESADWQRRHQYPVHFLGKLEQMELAKVYNTCDIFALPSFSEGLPLTVIEALACGDRVVMSDLPGIREWLDTYAPGADIRYVRTSTDEPRG